MNPPRARHPRPAAVPVPAFFLYGEPLQPPDERLIHVEPIAARSRLHNWHIHPHRHRDLHQLLLIRRGRAEATLDGRTTSLRAPLAIAVPPGVVHAFRFQPDTVGLVISFADALGRDIARATPGLAQVLSQPFRLSLDRGTVEATDLWPLGEMFMREFTRSARGRQVALRGLLAALLSNLWRVLEAAAPLGKTEQPDGATRVPTTGAVDRALVARFREIVEHAYRHHAGVADYAARLGCSTARLRRACLAACGQSPVELVHQRLLVEAERQLRYTSMSITQVAYFLGFEDPAYFSRFFSQRMNLSPRAFRTAAGAEIG